MKRKLNIVVLMVAIIFGLMTEAHAAPQTHDGFYLRSYLGFGSTTAETKEDPKFSLEGSGGAFGLSFGYMVWKNTGIFVEVSNSVIVGPDVKQGDVTIEATDEISAGVVGTGIGVVHYFMPLNLYVSGALMSDKLTIMDGDEKIAESDPGLGLSLMVGKEWWVSDDWGLGVAAVARSATVKDADSEWTANGFNLVFSATYN